MANYEYAKVACDDKEIISKLEERLTKLGYEVVNDNDLIKFSAKEGLTAKILMELTREHTDIMVEAIVSDESDWYTRLHHLNFVSGYWKLVDMEINYMYSGVELMSDLGGVKFREKAIKQIDKFYKKMDSVTKNNGRFVVDDNSDKDISVVFNIDNFEIETFKHGSEIVISNIKRLSDHKNWAIK